MNSEPVLEPRDTRPDEETLTPNEANEAIQPTAQTEAQAADVEVATADGAVAEAAEAPEATSESEPAPVSNQEESQPQTPLSRLESLLANVAERVEEVVETVAEKAQVAAATAVLAVTEPLVQKEDVPTGEAGVSAQADHAAVAPTAAAASAADAAAEGTPALTIEPERGAEPDAEPSTESGEPSVEQFVAERPSQQDPTLGLNAPDEGPVEGPVASASSSTSTVQTADETGETGAFEAPPPSIEIASDVATNTEANSEANTAADVSEPEVGDGLAPAVARDLDDGAAVEAAPVTESADVPADAPVDGEEVVIKVPKRRKAAPKADKPKAEKSDKPKAPRKSAKKAEKLPDPGDGSGYEAPQTAEGADATEEAHWYAVHCYSGYENKVKHNLEQRIETMGMAGKILEVVVPTEDEIEVRDGKRRTVEKRVFPGYVMVNMKMSEESWHVVRNTPGVTRFIGMGNRPQPLSQQEVNQIVRRMEAEAPKIKVNFRVGQKVRITDGPFADFMGLVDKIDTERAKVSVLVSFFGRETPVELDFLQVEKM